jgi:pseudouridylate synthase
VIDDVLRPTEEVRDALDSGRPVVALETSVVSHGLPADAAAQAAADMDAAVRTRGGVPAWIWTGDGAVRIGAGPKDLERLIEGRSMKVARRDLPAAVARAASGGTTVSATVWAAHRAGIEVVATGGIGGVHPGSGDVSADLGELGRTPATLVCSGPKSILDPQATLERLEELGVAVIGYRCDRLPFFLVSEAPLELDHRADDPGAVADVVRARRAMGIDAALVVANPVPEDAALPADEIVAAVDECRARASDRGIAGKALTPFLLGCLTERTGGAAVGANLALLASNAGLAAEVAAEVAG